VDGAWEDLLSQRVGAEAVQDGPARLYGLLVRVGERTGGLLRLPLALVFAQRFGSVYEQGGRTDSLHESAPPVQYGYCVLAGLLTLRYLVYVRDTPHPGTLAYARLPGNDFQPA
jgi:hypothetical protein